MNSSKVAREGTRREFLGDAVRLAVGAAALATLGPQAALSAFAQGGPPERVKVLLDDLVESTAADFARGQARGVKIAVEAGHAALRGSQGGKFTSGVVSLPFPSTHLGLHWVVRDAPPEALAVEVRAGDDGITWSNWQRLTIEAVASLPSGQEVFAALIDGRRGRFAQYRVMFQTGQIATVDRVTVTAINSVDGPREPLAATVPSAVSVSAAGNTIDVISREGWGCDENLRFRVKTEIWPEMYVPAKKVVLHHTATSNGYIDGAAEVRAIYAYHARTLGWGDIGYNSLIDNSGLVYEGRHGRGEGSLREILSAGVVAGHVTSHNYGSTGIAAIGNFDQATPTDSMLSSINNAVTFECGRHFIDPVKASDFLRSDNAWHSALNNVSGHDESYSTECPGAVLKSYLPTIRDTVVSRLGVGSSQELLNSTSQTEQAAPGSLSFSCISSCSYCLEGWYKPPTSENISYLSGCGSGGYNDPLARAQVWAGPATSARFAGLAAGHYTMHVRAPSGRYEANLTFLVKKSSSSGKPPKK